MNPNLVFGSFPCPSPVIREAVNEGLVAAALEAFTMLVDPTSGAADVELWTMLNRQLNAAEKVELNARLAGWVK